MSDKTACKEYGLTQDEIHIAVCNGRLQYRENHIHGNPYLRLLRKEVEALAKELHGAIGFTRQKLVAELKSTETQIRSCKLKLTKLEKQKAQLLSDLELISPAS